VYHYIDTGQSSPNGARVVDIEILMGLELSRRKMAAQCCAYLAAGSGH
jgi:hypothetical protein